MLCRISQILLIYLLVIQVGTFYQTCNLSRYLGVWYFISATIYFLLFNLYYYIMCIFLLQALSAANLELVVYVCETVNPAQIFNQTPCPLEQPVLLSLIQQLSADIGNNTELKHK